MATVKELRAQAEARGLTGYGKQNKAQLEELLAHADETPQPAAPAEPKGSKPRAGVPTELAKANLNRAEKEALGLAKPREPKPEREPKAPTPSLTGAEEGIGVPTEPKRGGLNKLEREQAGIT